MIWKVLPPSWRKPGGPRSGIRTSRATGGSTHGTTTATGWSSWRSSGIEVRVADHAVERLERGRVAGELELLGRAVAVRVRLEVRDGLDLRVRFEGAGRVA